MKLLQDVPCMPLNDIKKAPLTGFERAQQEGTGVYITRWNTVVGVMLTREQYEELVKNSATTHNN